MIMAKIFLETYGCTLNQSDSDIMESLLKNAGHTIERGIISQSSISEYDHIIINTCTVKKPTEQKILNKLEKLSKTNNNFIITGCLASASPELIKKAIPNAKLLKTNEVVKILEVIDPITYVQKSGEKPNFLNNNNNIIARIPISEGCLSSCSFCETKFARGPLKSFSEDVILRAIKNSVINNAKEIELTSQDVGAYGADKKTNIAELISHATNIDGEFMMRIGMLNPEHLHKYFDDLILSYKSPKIFKFIHLPIQSGSDKVLKNMKRRYKIEDINNYIKELRKKIKGISIMTDIIVGYPSESYYDFTCTKEFILNIKPNITNISKFWQRPHTPASKMKQLTSNEIKERSTKLSRLVRAMQAKEYKKSKGSIIEVLVTESNKGFFSGRDIYYRPIAISSKNLFIGQKIKVKVYDSSYACILAKPL